METCIIRKIYCGDGKIPKDTRKKKYSRKGTSYECLQRGYGIADWEHRKKNLSKTSLQQIIYVGPSYEARFKRKHIYSITSLLKVLQNLSASEKKDIIEYACTKKNGSIDQKAVNSVIVFLHDRGIKSLPRCKITRE